MNTRRLVQTIPFTGVYFS